MYNGQDSETESNISSAETVSTNDSDTPLAPSEKKNGENVKSSAGNELGNTTGSSSGNFNFLRRIRKTTERMFRTIRRSIRLHKMRTGSSRGSICISEPLLNNNLNVTGPSYAGPSSYLYDENSNFPEVTIQRKRNVNAANLSSSSSDSSGIHKPPTKKSTAMKKFNNNPREYSSESDSDE